MTIVARTRPTGRAFWKCLGGALLASLLALAPGSAEAQAPVVDQSFTTPMNLGANINECCAFIAQTFTAGRSGILAGVSVDVASFGPYPLHLAILSTTGGMPGPTVLAETTLAPGSVPLSTIVSLPQAMSVVAGEQYAIVASFLGAPPAGAGQFQGIWYGATGDAYPGGMLWASGDGVSWFTFGPDFDLHFQTYVATSLTVAIDIRPGYRGNVIEIGDDDLVPVAVLSSPTFEAPTVVDRQSLTFGRAGIEPSLASCEALGRDVNGDGLPDLVCRFRPQQAGFQVGDTTGVLRGRTLTGEPFSGTDAVRIEP
jgi:hypothetical protein